MENLSDNEKLWGEDLHSVFGDDINEQGWLTAEWGEIIEKNVPRFNKDFSDNPKYKETYGRMYNLDYEESEDGLFIRPIVE